MDLLWEKKFRSFALGGWGGGGLMEWQICR